ncbi:primase C-terminal domain-containing protein [Bacteroides faecalis]|uniref:Primase C-terminal 1 domain-containing protein n=1 Tax=Bacteroides faecalis TaxID=2447885 RepID=A0A401LQP3_9BACE|nr:hypothetical protein KGMB02408_07380 [Bacteroides faecalis]
MNSTNSQKTFGNIVPDKTKTKVSQKEIKLFLSSYIFLKPLINEQRHTNLFKLAYKACRRGYPHESILREINPFIK